MLHLDPTGSILGLVLVTICWGVLHGLTPHGHSWLVLLPFALGGMKARGMARMAIAYSLGMLVTAAIAGALLGWLSSLIPMSWHYGVDVGIGVLLMITGIVFLLKPLSIHHAIDHMCDEECHSGEERALLRSGTMGAMFIFGVISMVIPCPTLVPMYAALTTGSHTWWEGALFFTLYAVSTGLTITIVAVAMSNARTFVQALEDHGHRLVILRLSGVIMLVMGCWLLGLGSLAHPHSRPVQDIRQHIVSPNLHK